MELPIIPPLSMPNGYDLNSIKTKTMNMNLSRDDISNAIFYRIPVLRDEETKSLVKSHSISQLPEYMPFSHEELRYLNIMKRQNKNFDFNSNYCNITREDKLSIYKKMSDQNISISFETADKNKLNDWVQKINTRREDDTFKGMAIIQNNFINSLNNNNDNSTPGRSNDPFFRPQNTLNSRNNTNQFSNQSAGSNFNTGSNFNKIGNSNPQSTAKFSFTNSTPTSFNPVNNQYNNNNNQGVNDCDFFNDNNKAIYGNNNRFSPQYGVNSANNFTNNLNTNQNNFNRTNTSGIYAFNTTNSQNFQNNQGTSGIGMKPSTNFSFNTNNNNNFNTGNLNPEINFNNANNFQNTNQFLNNNTIHNYNNQTHMNNNSGTESLGNQRNFNFNANSNFSNQNDYLNYASNTFNNNYNQQYLSQNSSQLNQSNINTFLDTSIQNFMQYDDVITYLNDGKKENLYEKIVNHYLNNQYEEKREKSGYKANTKSLVVDFNEYKPFNYFIPSEITNPKDIKLLKCIYEGKKIDFNHHKNTLNRQKSSKNSSQSVQLYNNFKMTNNNINTNNIQSQSKQKEDFGNNYDTYLKKNKERTILKEKLDNMKSNHHVAESNRNNPFLIPVFKELPIKFDNKKNLNISKAKGREEEDPIYFTQSNNYYKLIVEFDHPRVIHFEYKCTNLLSIARLKSELINFLYRQNDFFELNIKPNDFAFVFDGSVVIVNEGVKNLDLLNCSSVQNTPISNISNKNSQTEKMSNKCKDMRVLTIRGMFTSDNDIIERYYKNLSRSENIKQREYNNNPEEEKINRNNNYVPILNKDYIITPTIENFKKMSESELKNVPRFTVTSRYGKIIYNKPIDLTYTNLDAFIFNHKSFAINKSDKTSFQKLYKESSVTLFDVFVRNEKSEEEFMKINNEINEICEKSEVFLNIIIKSILI